MGRKTTEPVAQLNHEYCTTLGLRSYGNIVSSVVNLFKMSLRCERLAPLTTSHPYLAPYPGAYSAHRVPTLVHPPTSCGCVGTQTLSPSSQNATRPSKRALREMQLNQAQSHTWSGTAGLTRSLETLTPKNFMVAIASIY